MNSPSPPHVRLAEPVEASQAQSQPVPATPSRAHIGRLPLLVTVIAVMVAGTLGWMAWDAYMVSAWTRDASVRADVVTMAPEVSGQIVALPTFDNKHVRKGDLLMVIDPTDYAIAVNRADASVQQAEASIQNVDAQLAVQEAQIGASEAQLHQTQAALVYAQEQTPRYRALAQQGAASLQVAEQYESQQKQQEATVESAQENLNLTRRQIDSLKAQRAAAEATLAQNVTQLRQAKVNLERTQIRSPVDGFVTNLLARRGDFIQAGQNAISVVDGQSFWIDGYFEETKLPSIHEGDTANISLMGYNQIVRGHVESFARAINVSNAQPNNQGIATVDPIYTWVRLAQRIPVRIHVDEIPAGVELAAGMTATVQIVPGAGTRSLPRLTESKSTESDFASHASIRARPFSTL